MTNLEKSWIGGFIAGEAYFSYYFNPKRKNHYFQFMVGTHLKDKEILEKMKALFGGKIYIRRNMTVSDYRVFDKKSLIRVVKFCDKYLLDSNKRDQFLVWKRRILENKDWLST